MWVFLLGITVATAVFVWFFLKNIEKEDTSPIFLENEASYIDVITKKKNSFLVLSANETNPKGEIYLSLVVPSYNEEQRLPPMLKETVDYLESRTKKDPNFTWEIIIVDDGSKDSTTQVGLSFAEKCPNIRVLTLKKNRGKGGAVKRGMLCARGSYLLMVDADGATKISDLEKLERSMKEIEVNGFGFVLGSRAHLEEDVVAQRNFIRNILMYGFHFFVSIAGVRGIKDTQCGFKLFTKKTAAKVFNNLHIERWAFDVELVYLTQTLHFPISEIPVNWQEIDGSKLSPFAASVQMARDILRIRANYFLGSWRVRF